MKWDEWMTEWMTLNENQCNEMRWDEMGWNEMKLMPVWMFWPSVGVYEIRKNMETSGISWRRSDTSNASRTLETIRNRLS